MFLDSQEREKYTCIQLIHHTLPLTSRTIPSQAEIQSIYISNTHTKSYIKIQNNNCRARIFWVGGTTRNTQKEEETTDQRMVKLFN